MPSRRRGSFLRQKEESRQQPAKFGSWAFVRIVERWWVPGAGGVQGRRGGVREPSELVPAAGRARARVIERRCHRVIAVGLTPSSHACVVYQDVSSAAWWSTEARGGTEAEVLSLALLVVRGCDVDDAADRAVRQWCDGVIADSPGYVDGAPWTSPRSWQGERRALVAQFRACVKPPPPGLSIEMKRGVMCALALKFESILVAPPVGGLEKYLGALLADEKKCLLGAGGGNTTKKGAPRRFTYLMPRVARLVRDDRAALLRLVAEGASAAMDATQAENDDAVAGETRRSAKKPRLKEMLADLSSTVAHLGETKSRKQAVRRAADTRENITAAVARRSEKAEQHAASSASAAEESARAAAAVAVEAAAHERDAAISRTDVAQAELRTLRQRLRLAEKKESDPPALKRKDKEIRELRAENHTLRVAASTHERDLAAAREAAETARQDYGEAYLPSRPSGKGAGRGRPHGPQLRGCYGKLLMLGVSAPNLNEVFATCAEV